jgi:hypothetical protein
MPDYQIILVGLTQNHTKALALNRLVTLHVPVQKIFGAPTSK